jgi:hypothetical protein
MQTLIIIFIISLIGILVMVYRGVSHVRVQGIEHVESTHPVAKHIRRLGYSGKEISVYIIHQIAIMLSRIWANISHRISREYRKITIKLENYFNHKNEANLKRGQKTQSILLTTIKAYKKEIKKLNGKIDPDQMRSKDGTKTE